MALNRIVIDNSESDLDTSRIHMDENTPLLLTLDPPGTETKERVGVGHRQGYSLLNVKPKRKSKNKLPFVIVFTAIGMAAMVVTGFMTMFQEPATSDNNSNATDPRIPITLTPAKVNGAAIIDTHLQQGPSIQNKKLLSATLNLALNNSMKATS